MLVVMLSGDVGAGKSTVMNTWEAMGARIIDSDSIAKEQWRDPAIISQAAQRWGDDIANGGEADLKLVAERAFTSKEEHTFLCRLLHPGTIKVISSMIKMEKGWVAVEIPLLFEARAESVSDVIVYATAPLLLRERNCRARGWPEGEVVRRERYLLPAGEKIARSHYVLENTGTLDEWKGKARSLGEVFLKRAGRA